MKGNRIVRKREMQKGEKNKNYRGSDFILVIKELLVERNYTQETLSL